MRCFISIDVEHVNVRDNLVTFIDSIRDIHGLKPVKPQNLHLTLLFLGDINSSNIHEVRETFVNITDNVNVGTFTCSVDSVGVFPHLNYIKVVWAGVKPAEELRELHMNYTEGMNFTSEQNEHDFVPHITLGRVKHLNNPDKSRLQELVRESDHHFGSFKVSNVRLKKSSITEKGPIYETLAECEL